MAAAVILQYRTESEMSDVIPATCTSMSVYELEHFILYFQNC